MGKSNGAIWIGCGVLFLTACGEGTGTTAAYPMLDSDRIPATPSLPPAASVMLEMIEVESSRFADWALSHPVDPTSATRLRREVQEWMKSGKARLVETSVAHVRSGHSARIASVSEVISPTEYRYPLRQTVTMTTDQKKDINDNTRTVRTTVEEPLRGVAPSGHQFAAREVGTILEVAVEIDPEASTTRVTLSGELGHSMRTLHWTATAAGGDSESFEAPVFEKNAIQTELVLHDGAYGFVGAGKLPESRRSLENKDSLLLLFLRADSNQTSIEP